MKKFIFSLIFFSSLSGYAGIDFDVSWRKTFDKPAAIDAPLISVDDDGGCFSLSSTSQIPRQNYLTKIDRDGHEQWQSELDLENTRPIRMLKEINTSFLYIVSTNKKTLVISKFNIAGQNIWHYHLERILERENYFSFEDIKIDQQGNLYLLINTFEALPGHWNWVDAIVIKLNSEGQQLWIKKIFNSPDRQQAATSLTLWNNSIFISGYTLRSMEIGLTRLTLNGNELWEKKYPGVTGFVHSLQMHRRSYLLMTLWTSGGAWFIKFDFDGAFIEEVFLPNQQILIESSIVQDKEDNLYFVGIDTNGNDSRANRYLVMLDPDLKLKANKYIGDMYDETLLGINAYHELFLSGQTFLPKEQKWDLPFIQKFIQK